MKQLLARIRDGETDFTPETEGLSLDEFQGFVKEVESLRAKGLIGPLDAVESRQREPRYGKVFALTVKDGLTAAGKREVSGQ